MHDLAQNTFDMLATILIIVVLLMLLGALPRWSHSRKWGYFPSGGLGLVLVICIKNVDKARFAREIPSLVRTSCIASIKLQASEN